MSKSFSLREVITERLTAAAEEIFGTVEQIVAEYQEEISRSKEENERLRGLLDISVKPVVKLHRTDPQLVTSVQQCEEKALPEKRPGQEWRTLASQSSLIKEEHYLSQQQPRELGPSFREPRLPSSCRKRDGRQNSRHSHLHQTLSEKSRERDPLPTNTAGDIDMHPHEEPQMFSHPICEEDDEAEPEWSPSVEPENLEPPHIKQEHDRWSSPEQPLMQRFDQDSILSSPCTSDRDLRIQQSLTDGNREEPSEALPTDTSGTIQIYPDGSDNADPQMFSQPIPISEDDDEAEQRWSPSLEQENLEPPHIKQEHELWSSPEQPLMRRYNKDSMLSSPCASGRDPRLHQSQPDENRRKDPLPLPTNTAENLQIFPDGSDNGEIDLTGGCSFWEKQAPTNQCKYCGKCYKRKGELNRHERVHTGKEPYQCKYCGKFFNHKGDLNRHEVVHTGHKPYRCKYCGVCYTKRVYLTKHEVIHTEEKLGLLAGLWLEQVP